jgi:hypothetical protein
MRMDSLGRFARGARWVALAALVASCGDEGEPADDGGEAETYFPCTEALCTAGSVLCCYRDGAPGTWNPTLLGCICPFAADADADGDGDADADGDADIGPDADGDVDLDVDLDVEAAEEADVEPEVGPDIDEVTDTPAE